VVTQTRIIQEKRAPAPARRARTIGRVLPTLFAMALGACDGVPRPGSEPLTRLLSAGPASGVSLLTAVDSVPTVTRRLLTDLVWDVSPDGRRVALTDWTTGDLVVRELAAGQRRRLTDAPNISSGYAVGARFSPDGARIAFGYQRRDTPIPEAEIRLVDVNGDPSVRTLFTWPPDLVQSLLEWSPCGEWLVTAWWKGEGRGELVLLPVGGGEPRVLRSLGWSLVSGIGFSPDGRHIAYGLAVGKDLSRRDVHVVAVDGSGHRALVRDGSDDYFLGWSPDGHVYFSSDRAGTPGVWRIPVRGGRAAGRPELVRPDLRGATGMRFDTEGRFYYGTTAGFQEVRLASIDPVTGDIALQPQPVATPAAGGTMSPAWSPDGRYLAYVANQALPNGLGRQFVAIRSLETGAVRRLPIPARARYLNELAWSHDGEALLLAALRDRGQPSLLRIQVLTGAVEHLPIRDVSQFAPVPGRPEIVLRRTVRREPGQLNLGQVVVHDLDSGRERVVAEFEGGSEPVYSVAVSPDASTIAVTVFGPRKELWLVPMDGGQGRVLVEHADSPIWLWIPSLAFTADGSGLYMAQRFDTDAGPRVRPWLVDVETGEATPLQLLPWVVAVIRPHPDGRRIATRYSSTASEFWVMENIGPVTARGAGAGVAIRP
jgi:Tol biopolymer transport system component